jgi:hypothetical protein
LAIRRAVRGIFIEACKNVTRNFRERSKMVVDYNGDFGAQQENDVIP